MMDSELNLCFPDKDRVIVSLSEGGSPHRSGTLTFDSPNMQGDREEFSWYFHTYASHYTAEPDDARAQRVVNRIRECGQRLFSAVFKHEAARDLLRKMLDKGKAGRMLTVSAETPAILSLPWELLHHTDKGGSFLFQQSPPISICRRFEGTIGARAPLTPEAKKTLRLLFIISRPDDAGFFDPHREAEAVMNALEENAPGRVEVEFLRPPTFKALRRRLEREPAVDIIHFDGHGSYHVPQQAKAPQKSPDHKGPSWPDSALLKQADGRIGHLYFERDDHRKDAITAELLGQLFFDRRVPLIVLSACQSAGLGDDAEPMGCTAARLTAAGIPAVIAMTYSVLIRSKQTLFGEFYRNLAEGNGIGASLDAARWRLFEDPRKHEVLRGLKRVPLRLYDWFLPALYQCGDDVPLLQQSDGATVVVAPPLSNLPARPEAGFFGRRRELWDIERWFAGPTRRISITGFGGQGKTALAQEAGRWLCRTGMFRAAVFVDYARIQSLDAMMVAVNEIGSVLGVTLSNAEAARAELEKTPTLVILDNLEALAAEPLRELLDAAVGWSEAGGSRVLCTTRKPDFNHPQYRTAGTFVHRAMPLESLGSRAAPDDALTWFGELMRLPPPSTVTKAPTREALIDLFDRVKFHPLSLRVLAAQLKTRRPEELGDRLEKLLLAGHLPSGGAVEDTPAELIASLQLSLEQLDAGARQVIPRLGVFQGGAMENALLEITEIDKDVWPSLRGQLEAAALVEAESLPGVNVPFLRFHPTLAPMLWSQLSEEEQARLSAAHRQRYFAVANFLYQSDQKNPHEARTIAFREMPNLLHAVHAALDASDPDAVDFADSVNRFLSNFGLKRESESLVAKAQAAAGDVGSKGWYLAQSNHGEQLFAAGRVDEAAKVFYKILEKLGDMPSYQRAVTLQCLGRCFLVGGRPDMAATKYRDAMAILGELQQTDSVNREQAVCLTDLATAFRDQGMYVEARKTYEAGLTLADQLRDLPVQGAMLGQLGTLAMLEGNLKEAVERYHAALLLFQQLGEPASEAVVWHQLGMVFQGSQQWDEAERHYRESARIEEQHGNLAGAAATWNQLAIVNKQSGKPAAAELWYRKAMEAYRGLNARNDLTRSLSNFASLLRTLPGRLAEARQLAEEALAVRKTLEPGAAEIWKSYGILAEIVEKEAETASDDRARGELQSQARQYRQLARDAKRNFPNTRYELKQHVRLIVLTILATQEHEQRDELEQMLPQLEQRGWSKLVAAICQLLGGERNADVLCDPLDVDDSMIVEAILGGLADPSSLRDLMPEEK